MNLKGIRFSATESTPEVILQPSGSIIISGRSMTKNADELYNKVGQWIDLYLKDPADTTCIDLWIEYLDGNSYATLISLLKKIMKVRLKSKDLAINWHYEEDDDEIMDQGENISTILNLPLNMVMIPEFHY